MNITVNKVKTTKDAIREVVVSEATVQNLIDAGRLASMTEGAAFMAALISQICTFDGKTMTYEEVAALPASVFLELSAALATSGVLPSENVFSSLSGTEVSATKQ